MLISSANFDLSGFDCNRLWIELIPAASQSSYHGLIEERIGHENRLHRRVYNLPAVHLHVGTDFVADFVLPRGRVGLVTCTF